MNGRHVFIPQAASGTAFSGLAIEGAPSCDGCSDTAQTAFILEPGTSDILFERVLHQCAGAQSAWYNPNFLGTFIWAQGNNSAIRVLQCALYSGINPSNSRGTVFIFGGNGSSLFVQNCLIANVQIVGRFPGLVDIAFHQNLLWGCVNASFDAYASGSATNNVLFNTPFYPYSVYSAYNAGNVTAAGSNWIALSASPFVNLPSGDVWHNGQYDAHLAAGSPCIDAGVPGQTDRDGTRSDIGIYGGLYPFQDLGASDFPFVTSLLIPASVPQDGVLPIHSTGRVGSGGGQ